MTSMPAPPTSADIDRCAASWAAREDLRPLDSNEEQALAAWLAEDLRHLGAYGRAKAVLARATALHGWPQANVSNDGTESTSNMPDDTATPTRRWMLGTMAVSAAAAAGAGVFLLSDHQAQEKRFATQRGEIRSLPLEDGSTVMLNTASELAVAFLPTQRLVRLVQGEAFFQVAKDPARPFLVESAGRSVRAIGTAFSVRNAGGGVGVIVREGRIRFEREQQASTPPAFLFADAETEILDYTQDAAPAVLHRSNADMARSLAWLDDQIAFDETPLGEAAVEFRRYSETPILMTPEVQKLRVSGRYSARDPGAFAHAVSAILGLRVTRTGQGIEISQ